MRCKACKGKGWLICTVSGSRRVPDGALEIEKCDDCERYRSDDEAIADPKAQKALQKAVSKALVDSNYVRQLPDVVQMYTAGPELFTALLEYVERHEAEGDPSELPEYRQGRAALALVRRKRRVAQTIST